MSMKYDVLYNFISPVTGRICADEDYVLVGDRNGFATSSPALIDLRLDLIHLRQDYNILSSASIIMGFPNTEAPNAQVLSKLEDGFVFNTAGIVSTINITPASADATYILQTPNDSLPNAQALNALSGIINPNGGILKTNSSGVISIASGGATLIINDYVTPTALAEAVEAGVTQAVTEAVAAAAVAFEAEMLPFTPLPNIGTQINVAIATVAAAEVTFAIAALRLNHISANGDVSFYDYKLIDLADPVNPTDGVNLRTLNNAISGATSGFVMSVSGTAGQIASTGGQNPVLSLIATGVSAGTYFNPIVGVDIYGRIVSISSDETSHTVTLIGDITGSGLVGSNISTTFTKTLNQISNAGNIDIANYALINVKDAVNPKDAVNLETLESHIADISTSIELQGDVTGIGNTGTPIDTTLELTLDEIKIAQGTVNLNNNRIKNLIQSPVEDFDAISMTFLWDLMHDEVNILWP